MKNVIGISLMMIVFIFEANGQTDFKKNLIQVGRSGYYFGDQPYRFGKSGVGFTNHGIRIYTYSPYLSYTRHQFKYIGFRVSFEEYDVSYCKDCPRPEPMTVTNRWFYQIQIGVLAYVLKVNKFETMVSINAVRRLLGSESGILIYIDKGWWEEAIGFGNDISAWGGGVGLEMKYRFYKNFSIAVKGEYIRFDTNPKNQLGLTGCIGFEF
ncbi:MAG: hypothetical protein IT270_19725 [Saprospiraceae bacterium]|nr:hypothetical protein [Saprospiraceae bacterium]